MPAIERALYVVATPLGNLRDISLRALDMLGAVDLIAAEDTRVTRVLLAHYHLATPLLSLHEHNERRRAAEIVSALAAGKSVALVSDAGTPAVSDPGALLVQAVAAAGYRVIPVPGASAVIAALSASGLVAPRWLFCGFLPATAAARRRELERLAGFDGALVLYEAPHRVAATAAALAAALGGERALVIARELTKRFESIHRCRLAEAVDWLAADPDRRRGEFVLIVGVPVAKGPQGAEQTSLAHDALLGALLAELPLARAVRVAVSATGAPRKELYRRALALRGSGKS